MNKTTNPKNLKDFKKRIFFREKLYFVLLVGISLFMYLFFFIGLLALSTALSIGLYREVQAFQWVIIPMYIAVYISLARLFFLGELRGNGIKATEKQFPLVMKLLKAQTEKLGMNHLPTVYISNGHGMLQGLALRIFFRDYIVLYSDVLATAIDKEGEDVVAYILGHELAHIRRGHVSFLKNLLILPGMVFFPLALAHSRAREYTCDAIGHYLAPKGAELGISLLAAGKHLYKKVDLEEYKTTGLEERGFATWWHELFTSHPHLVKRLAAVQKWNKK